MQHRGWKIGIMGAAFALAPLIGLAAFNRDLSFGSEGDDVKLLQEFLAKDKAIYPENLITGSFGPKTREAVKRFQAKERISPPAGYFGPKTRARVNELAGGTATSSVSREQALETKIAELQQQLKDLQAQAAASSTMIATSTAPQDTTPPVFLEGPTAVVGEATPSLSPFGADAPYQVAVSWRADETAVSSAFSCTPALFTVGIAPQATYWAKTGGAHACAFSAEDAAHNVSSKNVSFAVPVWTSFSGTSTLPIAQITKLGDVAITNHATTSVTLFRLNFTIDDSLDAYNSRGRSYRLVLRSGTTTNDEIIKYVDVPMHGTYPGVGKINRQMAYIYAGKSIDAGATQTLGLWVEGLLGPFGSGRLTFTITDITTLPDSPSVGSAEFTLSG